MNHFVINIFYTPNTGVYNFSPVAIVHRDMSEISLSMVYKTQSNNQINI